MPLWPGTPGSRHRPQTPGTAMKQPPNNPAGSTASRSGNPAMLGAMVLCSRFRSQPQVLQNLSSFLSAKTDPSLAWVVSPLRAETGAARQEGRGGRRQRSLTRVGISSHGLTVGLCRAARPPTLTPRSRGARPARSNGKAEALGPASHQPQQIFLLLRIIKPTSRRPRTGGRLPRRSRASPQQREQPAPATAPSRARRGSSGMLVHKTHSGKSQPGVTSPPR